MKLRRSWKISGLVLGTVAVAMISAATGVWASHSFTDVPNDHPFHAEIGAVEGACVAGGFPDGTYRPGEDVTRQAMAAFLTRAGSYAAEGTAENTFTYFGAGQGFGSYENLATVTVSVPDLADCNQQVVLHGSSNLFINGTPAASCDLDPIDVCNAYLAIRSNGVTTEAETFIRLSSGPNAGGEQSVQAVIPAGPGEHTYQLDIRGYNILTDKGIATSGSIIATVVPFGPASLPASPPAASDADVIEAETGQTP